MDSDKKYFSIGEVAKIKNITAKTLRYYHDIGLLIPDYVDDSNGYRYYTLEQLIHIDIIKMVRHAGGSIKELQNLYSYADMACLDQFLKKKNEEILKEIRRLEQTQIMIKMITDKIEESQSIAKMVGFNIKYYSERYLMTGPLSEVVELNHVFEYFKLEDKMNDYEIKSKYEQGILYKSTLAGELEPTNVFEVIDNVKVISKELGPSLMALPKGYFLTYTISKEMYDIELKRVIDYLNQKKINTNYLLLFELYNDMFKLENYYYQIQVYIGETPQNL